MSRVYKTKDGSHDFYSGVTKVASIKADGSFQDINGITLANDQDIQNAAGDKASYQFNGAAKIIKTTTPIIGNARISILCEYMQQMGGTDQLLAENGTRVSAHDGFFIGINSTGYLFGGATSNLITSTVQPTLGEWHTSCVTYDGANIRLYHDAMLIGTLAYSSANFSSLAVHIGMEDGGGLPFKGQIARVVIPNVALSASKIARYSAGAKLDYEDIGGSMAEKWDGNSPNFSTWSYLGGSYSGTPGVLNNTAWAYKTFQVTPGKRYRVVATFTGATQVAFRIGSGVPNQTISLTSGVPVEFTALNSSDYYTTIYNNSGSTLTFTQISLVQIGAVLDLEPEGITSPTWYDQSGNNLHGTVTGALSTNGQIQEGTWTPIDSSGGGLTLTVSDARWSKVGRLVTAQANITYPSTSDVNLGKIGGLPFISAATGGGIGGCIISLTSYNTTPLTGVISNNNNFILWYNTGLANIINSALSTKVIRFIAVYLSRD